MRISRSEEVNKRNTDTRIRGQYGGVFCASLELGYSPLSTRTSGEKGCISQHTHRVMGLEEQ